ncbi:cysteine desulfurase family protein [Desulfosudis oleivorans]|uniref:cysteine desulfurase n=1 Tax=Desulfosudis oleivorans (strain DSM 6200 / JCM 39069 / Hxd3) TaxID=96561 RepID=A8ZVA5_DESOH|nr:cysteine desulfurase family protein [Desulfosudis oleivorans]ABW66566.1 aminotransferase class V [Desulfosudis oleivorans Hxd3]
MSNIHLDHISVSPLLPEVQEAMIEVIRDFKGNPSSQNVAGELAAEKLEKARQSVADLINCDPREVVFVSGGTESINMAVKGVARANVEKGKHIVTSNIEHNAVNRSVKRLMHLGWKATSVAVNEKGRVAPDEVAKAIREDTILVSIMHSNNEIGTLQPIDEIAKITKEKKVLLHTDAVDSVGVIPFDVQQVGADLVSFASNPYYGPTGVGALYIRKGSRIWPIIDGGVQEHNRRAGTENLIGIVGMGVAAELAKRDMDRRVAHLKKLKALLVKELPNYIDEYYVNGDIDTSLPNLVSVSVKYVEGESLMLMLEDAGYTVSTRSACATGSLRASHVLMSIGLDHADAQGTLVITPGIDNTEEDILGFLKALRDITKALRDISPLYKNR